MTGPILSSTLELLYPAKSWRSMLAFEATQENLIYAAARSPDEPRKRKRAIPDQESSDQELRHNSPPRDDAARSVSYMYRHGPIRSPTHGESWNKTERFAGACVQQKSSRLQNL